MQQSNYRVAQSELGPRPSPAQAQPKRGLEICKFGINVGKVWISRGKKNLLAPFEAITGKFSMDRKN